MIFTPPAALYHETKKNHKTIQLRVPPSPINILVLKTSRGGQGFVPVLDEKMAGYKRASLSEAGKNVCLQILSDQNPVRTG
jgi:hypothetical protein